MIVEIKSSDGHCFFVRAEFLKICPNPTEWWAYDLINQFNLISYLATFNQRLEDLINE